MKSLAVIIQAYNEVESLPDTLLKVVTVMPMARVMVDVAKVRHKTGELRRLLGETTEHVEAKTSTPNVAVRNRKAQRQSA